MMKSFTKNICPFINTALISYELLKIGSILSYINITNPRRFVLFVSMYFSYIGNYNSYTILTIGVTSLYVTPFIIFKR